MSMTMKPLALERFRDCPCIKSWFGGAETNVISCCHCFGTQKCRQSPRQCRRYGSLINTRGSGRCRADDTKLSTSSALQL